MRLSAYEKKLLWLLALVALIGTVLLGAEFLSMTTLVILMNQVPEYGLITIALMMTLIVSGLNLSVVSMTTLSGVLGGIVMEQFSNSGVASVIFGLMVMMIVGLASGAINGIVVSYLEVSPILTTLGTMLFYKGIALNITKGGAITSFHQSFTLIGSGTLAGIPVPFVIFIAVVIGVAYLLEHHEIGHQIYRIGKNPHSAVYSGIDVKKMVLLAYMAAGIITGIAAIVMTARYNSIRVDYGSSYLISGIVAVSLGGVELRGGRGTVKGVLIALLILTLLIRILNLLHVDSSLIDGIMGLILLGNVVINYRSKGES